MKVLVCSTTASQYGLPARLLDRLHQAGCEAEQVAVPLSARAPENLLNSMLVWQSMDLTEADGQAIDLLIATDFPSYLVSHPRKVVWLPSLYPPAYDNAGRVVLDSGGRGLSARNRLLALDRLHLMGESPLFAVSQAVADALDRELGAPSPVLPDPEEDDRKWSTTLETLTSFAEGRP